MGLDTVEIAERIGVSEAVASRRVYVQRCREKGLPVETERRSA
jgi:transposase